MWVGRDAGRACSGDHPQMQPTYGVVWREGTGEPATGKLELLPRALRLEGRDGSQDVPYEDVAAIRVGRSRADRINGGPAVVVERRGGERVIISTVAQPSLIGEIAERLAALQLGVRKSRRIVVVLPLKSDAHESVSELLKQGPPFDPASIEGLERHEVFLTPSEAVFVFESELEADALDPLIADPKLWERVSAWGQHVAGAPRIAEEAFAWSRAQPDEDVFYLATPGPGNSEGGDVY
jgi:hypothetical protein